MGGQAARAVSGKERLKSALRLMESHGKSVLVCSVIAFATKHDLNRLKPLAVALHILAVSNCIAVLIRIFFTFKNVTFHNVIR